MELQIEMLALPRRVNKQKLIKLDYRGLCPSCGKVNIETKRSITFEEFETQKALNPSDYWSEKDCSGKTQYRLAEETREARCIIC